MTTFGISMVKDEADVIEQTAWQMCRQVDHVMVMDNGSTDGTQEILRALGVEVIDVPDPAYYQSERMTTLAALAANKGASWVVCWDADEWWYSPFGRIADVLNGLTKNVVATAAIYDHRATARDSNDPDPIKRMGWRTREPLPLHKIAAKPVLRATITQGNHSAHFPSLEPAEGQLVVRHFPLRSPEQMVRKARAGAAAYAATNLPLEVGAHWRQWGQLSDAQLGDVFREFYWSADPESDPDLMFDPCPVPSKS